MLKISRKVETKNAVHVGHENVEELREAGLDPQCFGGGKQVAHALVTLPYGVRRAEVGDYVVIGPNGAETILSKAEFEEKYDAVEIAPEPVEIPPAADVAAADVVDSEEVSEPSKKKKRLFH